MKPPSHTRDFYDPERLRELINNNALVGFQKKLNEIEVPDYKLKVTDLELEDKKFSFKEQKDAIFHKKDLTIPLKGTIDLIDKKTGDTVESKRTTIAAIPYVTERNTVIYNGSEYEPVNQQRLLPGVYTRIRQSGEAEALINCAPRTGITMRILFMPEKQLFILMIQNTQIKLYGLLHDMGVSEKAIKEAWGEAIYNANRAQYDGNEVAKLHDKIFSDIVQ